MPEDLNIPPEGSIMAVTVMQHEWVVSWEAAGFTREEALDLLKHQMFVAAHMSLHEGENDADA